MLHRKNYAWKRLVRNAVKITLLVAVFYSCASIGRPDGGPIDETPPRFVGSSPTEGALNNTRKRIVIEFDEFIKLEKPNEKVVVSPPQIKQPEIKPSGKKITINLLDSLKANTTYTIDFSDAIVDNNEGNQLGDFAFTFATGNVLDTMQVSGVMLEAETLEPVKGMLVGLHSNLNDSAFTTIPFDRVSRTDSRGRFVIRGVASGNYHIFGLNDSDQNFIYSQKSEAIAFSDSLIIPRLEERLRADTLWVDSLTIDTIVEKRHTYYLPDHVILRSFKEASHSQYLIKNERTTPYKITLYFAAPADTLPTITGLNFDEQDAFIIEKSLNNDTIHYWIKDSLLYKQDTLSVQLDYLFTDTLNQLVPRTDTLRLVSRKEKKETTPKKKKKEEEVEHEPTAFISVNTHAPSSMNIYDYVSLTFDEPVLSYDSTAFHLREKIDTLWVDIPFTFEQDALLQRKYNFYHEWEFGKEYEFMVDSTAFKGQYGLFSDKIEQAFKVRDEAEYGAVFFNVVGVDTTSFVQLLDMQDKVLRQVPVLENKADFYYLDPGQYTARLVVDTNNNGKWDTGNYAENLEPEMVYYYPQKLDLKANWELEQDWNVTALPLDEQKLDELKKQKPDEDKKKRERDGQNSNRNQRR